MSIEHERVRAIRKAAGIKTQAEFAEFIDVSTETISKIEQGKNAVSLPIAKKIADKFGTTLDYIYGLSDDTSDDAATMLLYLKKLFGYKIDSKYKKCPHIIAIPSFVGDFLEKYANAKALFDSGEIPQEAFDSWVNSLKAKFNANMSNMLSNKEGFPPKWYHLLPQEYAKDYIITMTTTGAQTPNPPVSMG